MIFHDGHILTGYLPRTTQRPVCHILVSKNDQVQIFPSEADGDCTLPECRLVLGQPLSWWPQRVYTVPKAAGPWVATSVDEKEDTTPEGDTAQKEDGTQENKQDKIQLQ